jgi:MFS transporter, DHA2 family, multidrug resistance protein
LAGKPDLIDFTLLSPRQRIIAGIVLALSNFMVVLDLTVANVSVPHIAGNMGITIEQGTWIITSYAVAEAIVVPLTGWLAQRFGIVRTFIFSMMGFGLFSFLCGVSTSLGMIVACRIGQGLFGGPMMPMSQTLLLRVFPPKQHGAAMGAWAMTVILGPAIGPILGGWISDEFSWHWIFLINIPIAIGCISVAWFLLPPLETPTLKVPIDTVGLLLLVFWIGCLQIMLDIGRDHDWFGDWKIVALAVAAFIGFCVFVIWELTEEHPIVDLRIFRHVGYSTSLFAMSLSFSAFFAGIVVVPQWLQVTLGYSATKAGMVTAMHAYAAILVAQFAARLGNKVDPRILITFGLGWMAFTSVLRAQWTSGADFWSLAWPMLLQGMGVPFMMIPLTIISLNSVRPQEMASGTGLQNFVRTMSTALATSVVLTIWGNAQREARTGLASNVQAEGAMADLVSNGMSHEQARAVVSNMVEVEAVTLAVNYTMYVAAAFFVISAAAVWLAPRVHPPQGETPMGH